MPRSKRAGSSEKRPHIDAAQIGRQLRAAFEPVPIRNDDFADLLVQLEAAERKSKQPLAAE